MTTSGPDRRGAVPSQGATQSCRHSASLPGPYTVPSLLSFLKKNNFIYLFLAVLDLHCCMNFSLVAGSRGYSSCCILAFSLMNHGL